MDTDTPTLAEALAVLDDAVDLLDGAITALYTWRDQCPEDDVRDTLAEAGDLLSSAWAQAARGRHQITTEVPIRHRCAPPAETVDDVLAQIDAALSTGRHARRRHWTVRRDPANPVGSPWFVWDADGVLRALTTTQREGLRTVEQLTAVGE